MHEIPRKILYILIVLTILGEAFSIYTWANNPAQRWVLVVDWVIPVLNAAVMVPLNLLALFWIIKRKEWSPFFLIAISVGNRIASQFFFDSGMHGIFISWTILLVFFAYLTYRQLNRIEILSILAGVLSGFPVFYYVFMSTYNEVIATIVWVLVIASWIGALKAIVKFH